jgi:hypothetical protein
MAFVKVVGGSEIYNFRIQCFVHFSTKVWRNFRSKSSSLKHSRPGRRRAATSRSPCAVPARRTKPPPTEAAPSLGVRAPNAPHFYPVHVSPSPSCRTRAPCTGRAAGPSRAHRTHVDRDAAVPRWFLCRHYRVTSERLFKVAPPPLARAVPSRPPSLHRPPWKPPPPSTSLASS